MKLINLTPHDVTIFVTVRQEGTLEQQTETRVFPSQGVARVKTTQTLVEEVDGIPLYEQTFGDIEGLPEPQPDTLYIVSAIVKEAAKAMGRTDVVSPDTSPSGAVRDKEGRIIGVCGLLK